MTVELSSLAELEPALAAEGFFGRDELVAHVYVGYRTSDALRRTSAVAPPEPCALPAVEICVRFSVPNIPVFPSSASTSEMLPASPDVP